MYYLILLTLIALALFFSYLHTKMKKEYVYIAWKEGVKKALALLSENEKNIPEAISINNKRIVAIKLYYAFFDKKYWKDTCILNAQNAAMMYVNDSADFDINPAVGLSEDEIIALCDKFAIKNKRSLCLIRRNYMNGKDPQIEDYINHLENNENLL